MSKVALVVDDSMLIRYSMCRFLETRGFVVETATNGGEGLGVLERKKVDVILTDMRMPKMSGSEFITALRGKNGTNCVPVIVLTSKTNGASEADPRADFVIYKDIDVEAQLDLALEAVTASKGRGRGAGK
jgi:CheY-like chemotaxis protein